MEAVAEPRALASVEADGIERGIRSLEALMEVLSEGFTEVEEVVEAIAALEDSEQQTLIREAFDYFGGLEELESLDPAGVMAYESEQWLEVSYLRKYTMGIHGGDLHSVTALLTFGGPNVWVTADSNAEWLNIEVYWGSDQDKRRVYAPNYAQYLVDSVEGAI